MIASSAILRSPLRPPVRSVFILANPRANVARYPSASASFHSSVRSSAKPGDSGKAAAATQKNAKKPAESPADPRLVDRVDPHQMASDFIKASPDARPQGTEALASMTPEQKMRNYATAAVLMGFVGWVWWYSMQSVGRSDGGFEELQAEAEEARAEVEKKSLSEMEAERLAEIDVTMSTLETEDGEDIGEEVVVAVAAPDEIARAEEEMILTAKEKTGGSGRPLWKKVVFFWRRE